MPVSRDFGGAGCNGLEFVAAFEALAGTMRSLGFAMAAANQATLIDCIHSMGTREQQIALLPRLLDGEPGATAISERGTGTEIRALQARLTGDKHGYRLNGHKYNISLAPDASIILVAARYDDDARTHTSLVLLDAALPGIVRSGPQGTLGVRDLPIGDLQFDDVPVDRQRVLGAPRDGLKWLMHIASMNRAYFALSCASVVRPFLADALAYAAERKILDVPIDAHQYVQRRLVDVRMRAERSRWMALAALGQWLHGDPDALESCSIAKITAAQDLTQSAIDLLALHGSDGYRYGALSTFVTDALAMVSAGGTEEMHRRNVFAQMQRRRERDMKTAVYTPAVEDTAETSAESA
ncbi:acyl-CoA dehydrogenase family protein [Trinickia acidisoli]|uniref:acyl-CoA dehydrogenase family protein n=1 Tax=Trinickia acidisoli TaxID=2767482 RepID=UPI002852E3D7|nr:acyl-CoA dehydrogenase family protein [Trinickia acidisoli]